MLPRMRRPLLALECLAALTLLACGGSASHSSTTASAPASAPTTSSSVSAQKTSSSTTLTASSATTSAGPGPGTPGSTGSAPAPGQEKIRLPANFTVHSGGRLTPAALSAPAFLAVSLSVASGDQRLHRIVVRTRPPHSLLVPAGGRASVLIAGLRPGRYAILVDGKARGTLDVGGEPGP
jgi:hypothetical protein